MINMQLAFHSDFFFFPQNMDSEKNMQFKKLA